MNLVFYIVCTSVVFFVSFGSCPTLAARASCQALFESREPQNTKKSIAQVHERSLSRLTDPAKRETIETRIRKYGWVHMIGTAPVPALKKLSKDLAALGLNRGTSEYLRLGKKSEGVDDAYAYLDFEAGTFDVMVRGYNSGFTDIFAAFGNKASTIELKGFLNPWTTTPVYRLEKMDQAITDPVTREERVIPFDAPSGLRERDYDRIYLIALKAASDKGFLERIEVVGQKDWTEGDRDFVAGLEVQLTIQSAPKKRDFKTIYLARDLITGDFELDVVTHGSPAGHAPSGL